MAFLMFVKAYDTTPSISFHKINKRCYSKSKDDIKNAPFFRMAEPTKIALCSNQLNDLGTNTLTHAIQKASEDSTTVLGKPISKILALP